MDRYNKYLSWYKTELEKPRSSKFMLFVMLIGWLVIILGMVTINKCTVSEPVRITKAHYTEQQQKYIHIFTKYGSTQPEAMACAVTKTKKPALMAALAIRESNGNPHAIGDSKQSRGAFQVQPKHWGAVPSTATEQAQQAEEILNELVATSPRGSLRYALSRYNTGKPASKSGKRYAIRVLTLAEKIRRG